MEPIIKVKDLNFTYNKGKDNEFQALIDISLRIYPEEFVIVFGPSGCGKSTLLNVMAGLELPDSGSISVFGRDLTKMNKKEFARYHRREVGMIYQAYNLITSLTVLDNVALPQIFVNVHKKRRERWSRALLERFDIAKHAKKIPTELSGGQQQRIGIARAIVNNPRIVLADEPIGNLDSVSARNVFEILADLNKKEKKTIILVTHNPEYLNYGDRIIYMKDGIITREIVNREKGGGKEKKEISVKPPTQEIREMMRAYHGLSPEQINILIMPYKAKVFAHHFITTRNIEETKAFEEVIQRRLLGTISMDEFFDILNRSSSQGGVGFDSRTAGKIARRVSRLIRTAYFIYQHGRQRKNLYGGHDKVTADEKARKLTDYLLKTCYLKYYKHLNEMQIHRLQQAVKNRLNGLVQKTDFYKYLDLPFKDGGVGLNSKTARAVSDEMELILILGFGIVQKAPAPGVLLSKKKLGRAEKSTDVFAGNKAAAERGDKDSVSVALPSEKSEDSVVFSGANKEERSVGGGKKKKTGVPDRMDEGEIEKIVKEVAGKIEDAGMKDFGRVMGQAILRIKGGADYDRVGRIVRKVLTFRDVVMSSTKKDEKKIKGKPEKTSV